MLKGATAAKVQASGLLCKMICSYPIKAERDAKLAQVVEEFGQSNVMERRKVFIEFCWYAIAELPLEEFQQIFLACLMKLSEDKKSQIKRLFL